MRTRDVSYTVVGHWPFPLDMLRRDRSRAATPEDQEKIDLLSRQAEELGDTLAERRLFRQTPVTVRLVIKDAGRHERPLIERWKSYGWDAVDEIEARQIEREAAEDQKHLRMRALHAQAVAKLTPEELAAVEWFAPRVV